jgi:signal transduction histidine kinase
MNRLRQIFWSGAVGRVLVESWLLGAVLLLLAFPITLETTHFARSLYLLLLPLICALYAGLRGEMHLVFPVPLKSAAWSIVKEMVWGLLLCLGLLGMVMGLFAATGQMEAIRYSYAGTQATIVFILLAALEYLGVRFLSWGWLCWDRLRRRRYAWGLTHAILSVVGGVGLLALFGLIFYLVGLFKSDIWEIPNNSPFALAVFWLTLFVLLAFLLFVLALTLFLPPALVFSFWVARKMTARLETLARMTKSLRQGNLAARAEVSGEDEVAQLQHDFNGMAEDLEKNVQALQAEKDKVWQLMEARRELVAGISHELRNPVAIIQGYSDVLRRDWQANSPQEVERDLETIRYETARLQAIINDLLSAAQMEAGRLTMTLQAVEVGGLARRLVETFANLAWGSKRVQVSLVCPEETLYAWADALRLEQALVNLVQNAIRHTSPGGLVTVEVAQKGQQIWIGVEDTGEGISPEDLDHVWEKYYRGGSGRQPAQSGVGLGLALVKDLTEAMGGRVAVESQPGQGSLFQICLPVFKLEN